MPKTIKVQVIDTIEPNVGDAITNPVRFSRIGTKQPDSFLELVVTDIIEEDGNRWVVFNQDGVTKVKLPTNQLFLPVREEHRTVWKWDGSGAIVIEAGQH